MRLRLARQRARIRTSRAASGVVVPARPSAPNGLDRVGPTVTAPSNRRGISPSRYALLARPAERARDGRRPAREHGRAAHPSRPSSDERQQERSGEITGDRTQEHRAASQEIRYTIAVKKGKASMSKTAIIASVGPGLNTWALDAGNRPLAQQRSLF